MTTTAPKLLKQFFAEDYNEVLLDKFRLKHMLPYARVTCGPVKRLISPASKCLTDLEKSCLRTWASGGWWTPEKAMRRGISHTSICPVCKTDV